MLEVNTKMYPWMTGLLKKNQAQQQLDGITF